MIPEYFGSDTQKALQYRAWQLWTLLRDDPRFYCHGRGVGLADWNSGDIREQKALARLQGIGAVEGVPDPEDHCARLETRGLRTDRFNRWQSGPDVLDIARSVRNARPLPPDLTVQATGSDTPADEMAGLDALTQGCGVLLPMGAFLRGHDRPTVCLYASDGAGRIVGAAASIAQFHPDHPKGGTAWWGMLSTDESRRGERIALILGAMAMLEMNARFGFATFSTGIREGNAPSEALCTKLGLRPTGDAVVIAIDPATFAADRVTK
ncbi:hypothetical protein [Aestuariicoccus sp. MJ-SS9]|uniref:hypothetical protein n=1 Tax=Aestuariicoccus sp. MJ-SS9 TaxID=3079855 RepID=UPI00290F887E|nr:hypothetical protein [Aestuariicoccus sp. MJ-SS9]MDU8909790.1 hypothetical protein [Aestuariicoccus sp. MJ-SS9]